MVGAGVANILDRMRRAQQRHRREGAYIGLPDQEHRVFEQRLRVGDGSTIVQDVDRSLRLVSDWCRSVGQSTPAISGIKVGLDTIEMVVESRGAPIAVPDHVRLADDGRSLLIDRPTTAHVEHPVIPTRGGPGTGTVVGDGWPRRHRGGHGELGGARIAGCQRNPGGL